jgi:hypothetical protein
VQVVAMVTDLSLDGARVSIRTARLCRHQPVTVAFPRGVLLPAARLAIRALVVRSAPGHVGLMFTRRDALPLSTLAAWVMARERLIPLLTHPARPRRA